MSIQPIQLLTIAITLVMFVLMAWGRHPRHWVTLAAGGLMLLVVLFQFGVHGLGEALSIHSFTSLPFWYAHAGATEFNTGINWSTIFFLSGMMILAEEMSEAGFFDWLTLWVAERVRFKPTLLLLCFMGLSALLSMFVDSITVILFGVVATVRLARFLQFDPAPLVLAEIFAANLGGAATMSGDPPNIILGTSLGLGFWDFIQNNGVICLAGLCVVMVYFTLVFRTKLSGGLGDADPMLMGLRPADAIPDRKKFRRSVAIFLVIILLIMTHTLHGLTMPSIGILAAAAAMVTTKYPWELLKHIHWKTIGFLIGLFLVVSGLEQAHVLDGLAQALASLSGGDHTRMILILVWFTAVVSAFVDNVPLATVMVPVILSLSASLGMDLNTLAWSMSKGTDIGGIATPIGASANVAGVSIAAKEGCKITWRRYCRYMVPSSLLVLILSTFLLLTLH